MTAASSDMKPSIQATIDALDAQIAVLQAA